MSIKLSHLAKFSLDLWYTHTRNSWLWSLCVYLCSASLPQYGFIYTGLRSPLSSHLSFWILPRTPLCRRARVCSAVPCGWVVSHFFYIIKVQLGMSSYKCLFLPLDISLGYSSPSRISRSEGLNHFTTLELSRKPRQSELPPYSLSVPTVLTDFIIFIYFCSFHRHVIVPWSYLILISFVASETGCISTWGFIVCFSFV